MMKKIYILTLLFFYGYICNAQQQGDDDNNQRVEVIKMAYISRELNLSTQEAQNFWPVYNNYQSEIKQARNQYPDDEIKYEQKVVEIKQRYQGNFKKVLGNDGQRVNKVFTTDKQFRDILRNEYQNRLKQRQNFQQRNGIKPRGSLRRPLF